MRARPGLWALAMVCIAIAVGAWLYGVRQAIGPTPQEVVELDPEPVTPPLLEIPRSPGSLGPNRTIATTTAPTYSEISLLYATNRGAETDATSDLAAPGRMFGSRRGRLSWGHVTVTIPRDHRMGQLESPHWLIRKIVSPNPRRHVVLQEIGRLSEEDAMARLGAHLNRAADRAVLAFVHGYNTSFELAARRTGQIAYDLAFEGPTLFFSWPSQDRTASYTIDSQNARWSIPDMKIFLRRLAEHDAERIIVIAHSMGTRLLSRALAELVIEAPQVAERISVVILAAPDIDAQIFRDELLPKFRKVQSRVTVYASGDDTALKASKAVNGFRRIGDASEGLTPMQGVDLIDATGLQSDFFNHTYFGDNESILSDIFHLVRDNAPIEQRAGLVRVETDNGFYWRIQQN